MPRTALVRGALHLLAIREPQALGSLDPGLRPIATQGGNIRSAAVNLGYCDGVRSSAPSAGSNGKFCRSSGFIGLPPLRGFLLAISAGGCATLFSGLFALCVETTSPTPTMRSVVKKISPDGAQAVVAGGGTTYPDDGVLATSASLNRPYAVKVDRFGNLYIADSLNHRIRKVGVDGRIRTVAGNGLMGWSGDNGAAIEASLDTPEHVSIGPTGDLYVTTRNRVRKVVGACCGP